MARSKEIKQLDREYKKREREIAKIEESGRSGMVVHPGVGGRLVDVIIVVALIFVMLICIIPLWHVLMASISDGKELLGHSGVVWLPIGKATLDGYKLLFRDSSVMKGYLNTLIYVAGGTSLGLLVNIMGGYILSRDTKYRPLMILFFVFTTMFSGGTVPTYMVVRNLGLTGSRLALIIPGVTNAMYMLLVMNSFAAVDKSYVEAAQIDGAGHFSTMFKVILPQAKGMVLVTAINTAIMKWNSWFEASIYVPNDKQLWPLQLWVKQLTAENKDFLKAANPNYSRYLVQYVVIVIAAAPILICLPFFIGRLEKGMVLGGVKG